MLWHLPFLFWLVETARPRLYVELGVGEGVSYLAACQALDKVEPDARCIGIDAWKDASGHDKIPESLNWRNTELYSDFSQLIVDDPRRAGHRFEDGTIDLLLVNIDIDAETIKLLRDQWLPKLSPNGVILLHGLRTRYSEGLGQAFLYELSMLRATIRFEEGDGLAAVLPRETRDKRLAKLAELSPTDPGFGEVRHIFSRLGAAHYHEWLSRAEGEKAQAASKRLEAAEKTLTTLNAKLADRERAYDARSREFAVLQSETFDLKTSSLSQVAELERLRLRFQEKDEAYDQEISDLRATVSTQQRRLERALKEVSGLTKRLELAADERQTQTAEDLKGTVALTQQLRSKETEIEALDRKAKKWQQRSITLKRQLASELQALNTKREKDISAISSKLTKTKAQLDDLKARYQRIKSSVSWRATAPVRKVLLFRFGK